MVTLRKRYGQLPELLEDGTQHTDNFEECFEEAIVYNDKKENPNYSIKIIKENGQKNTAINIFILANIAILNLTLLNILS